MIKLLRVNLVLIVLTAILTLNAAAQTKPQPAQPTEIADDGVPVLIKNLPEWKTAQQQAVYARNLADLEKVTGKNPALEAVIFNDAEAVTAPYEEGQLAIIEFSTPQFAFENDARITAKLDEIKQSGQPVPIYRKVGNYAVFVFNATDETSANTLIDGVKYAKVVQWLGKDPYLYERAERHYVMTMGSVIVTVVRASGYALGAALLFGGLFGAWIFYARRKESLNSFSDAGGMMRLNLDNLTSSGDSQKSLKD